MSDPLFGPPAGDVARVALPLATEELFEYAVPSSLAQSARPGCRARVRFRDRPLTGVIVERVGQPRFEGALLPIERIVDPEPALSEAMIAILREAASEVEHRSDTRLPGSHQRPLMIDQPHPLDRL